MGLTTNQHLKIVIDSIDTSIVVDSVEVLGSGKYKLNSKNTKWATFGKLLNSLTITEVVQDVSITVKSSSLPVKGIFTLANPFFYYGTFMDTSAELVKTMQSNSKLPFIYLHLFSPENYASDMDTVDYTSDCAIYFMVDALPKNWLTGDHYTNAINQMKSLRAEFINSLKAYSQLNADNELRFTENDYVNFGKVQTDLGVVKQIFADNISGVEIQIQIPFNKCMECCN
jgi:hypothetical protein